jgi:hypothetical protein
VRDKINLNETSFLRNHTGFVDVLRRRCDELLFVQSYKHVVVEQQALVFSIEESFYRRPLLISIRVVENEGTVERESGIV